MSRRAIALAGVAETPDDLDARYAAILAKRRRGELDGCFFMSDVELATNREREEEP